LHWSPRRINTIAESIGARRYLEIGVSHGDTFLNINIPDKTAVDPAFAFDVQSYSNEKTVFYFGTSDEFFSGGRTIEPFDIVFIDGLHRFEQVVRDFNNAILFTHKKSVILIDDTIPNDVFSAIPDQEDALSFRRMTGDTSSAWHGDVYKIVFYIHDFWLNLRYFTISEGGNPQTLVWRSHGADRIPVLDSLEQISRLSYFDLKRFEHVMRSSDEESAIASCIADIGRPGPTDPERC
jgi:hypothetical protein